MNAYHDMHCHLDFMANGDEVAARAKAAGSLIFANTVSPSGWADARERFRSFDNVVVGFGMHPWWVPKLCDSGADSHGEQEDACGKKPSTALDQADDTERAKALEMELSSLLEAHDPQAIGEIGLDFGRRNAEYRAIQTDVFTRIVSWAGSRGGKLLSIHSVNASRETLEILKNEKAIDSCSCIFHWYSGPSDVLKQAVDAGCYFSCNPRMIATGKGREYIKAIPAKQLLLETDAPPEQGAPYSYDQLAGELRDVANFIARTKGDEALEVISETPRHLFAITNCFAF